MEYLGSVVIMKSLKEKRRFDLNSFSTVDDALLQTRKNGQYKTC
jgi:hypothetical protein